MRLTILKQGCFNVSYYICCEADLSIAPFRRVYALYFTRSFWLQWPVSLYSSSSPSQQTVYPVCTVYGRLAN